MPRFTGAALDSYPQAQMPDAAPLGDGPWGDAIKYWLRKKRLSQTELAKGTGLSGNTISSIVRGFPTKTSSLESIAGFLKVPIEAVLISPLRRVTDETHRQLMREALDNALRSVKAGQPLDEDTIDWAKRLQTLRGEFRDTATSAIKDMQHAQKIALGKKRGPGPSKK